MTNDQMDKKSKSHCDEDVLECQPIKSLPELLDWEPGTIDGIRAESMTVPLEKHVILPNYNNRSKVLVCHDMKGGYQDDDRFCTDVPNDSAYRFYHWSKIDQFVYFSHSFVTIPPVTWVNAAHKNGVQILGTLITEDFKLGISLFSDPATVLMVVQKLVAISKQHLIDGWLINIENAIPKTLMENLLLFITILSTEMHDQIPGSQIIWYDSVLFTDGRLSWQNQLNEHNLPFFQACDGIFLNYNWNVFTLKNSIQWAKSVNRNVEDVYVGIDVFGRGCFGGGGWNTRAAIDEIRKVSSDLSMAIFAPGWVHECNATEEFESNQIKFWDKLNLQEKHVPSELPIVTSFCQGFGKKLFEKGFMIKNEPWFNLSRQELIPGCHKFIPKKSIFTEDAFNGGSCLRLSFPNSANGGHFSEPVIKCHLQILPSSPCILVSFTFKPFVPVSSDSSPSSATGTCPLATFPSFTLTFTCPGDDGTLESVPLSSAIRQLNSSKIIDSFLQQNDILLTEERDTNGWKTLNFLITPPESPKILSEIGLKIDGKQWNAIDVLIGQLKILEAPSEFFPATS